MKNISFLSEIFQFLEVKLFIYLNRRVFVMNIIMGFSFNIAFLARLNNVHGELLYYPQRRRWRWHWR